MAHRLESIKYVAKIHEYLMYGYREPWYVESISSCYNYDRVYYLDSLRSPINISSSYSFTI